MEHPCQREVDWTSFHSAKGVWSLPIPHDPTCLDDQTQVDIEAIACMELNIEGSSIQNSK